MLSVLDTPRAADFLGVSPATLEKWRVTGEGPPFLKLGARVLYAVDDLIGWVDERRRCSTAESIGVAQTGGRAGSTEPTCLRGSER